QASTPGTQQTGNTNISGVAIAQGFVGNGNKLTTLDWNNIVNVPATFPPGGAAGGDLSGTYPNPTLKVGVVDSARLANSSASLTRVAGGLMVANGNNVGMGTSSPSARLSMSSDNANTKIAVWDG